jgi:hypothetical protein
MGREKYLAYSPTRTPPQKIRVQFQGHKHTSFVSLIIESWKVRLTPAENELRNVGETEVL